MGWLGAQRAPDNRPAPQPPPPQPQPSQDPYEVIKVPKLPDLTQFPWPHELQVFREQCAAGVRQAVAMVTAMEHQLWWERSRRQQAEEDIKVLLSAIDAERSLADGTLQDMQGALTQAQREVRGDALVLRADQLPDASKAATVIQKNFRGHAARKDFENNLKEILRGVDPELDPSGLPEVAQHHISAVNSRGGHYNNKGLKASMQGMQLSQARIIPGDQVTQHLRKEVDAIHRRMEGTPDAGYAGMDPSLDPSLDIKRILQGSLPASSASVIAALVRRCKELQAALVEACNSLQQSRMAEQGLRAQNMKVVELSQAHIELEQERQARQALQQTISKLRHALLVQQGGGVDTGGSTAKENPHMAAWYRRQYADGDFVHFKPGKGPIAGGKYVFAGPEAEVELWDDMRPGVPEPIFIPKGTNVQYGDLLALQSDLAAGVKQGPFDPLYYNAVPDTSQFSYSRDTPIVPISTPLQMIRESGLSGGGAGQMYPGGYGAYPQPQQPAVAPIVPMYSVLPLIKEDAHMSRLPDNHASFAPPPPLPIYKEQPLPIPPPAPLPIQPPQPPQPTMCTPPQPPPPFVYHRDTPRMTVNSPLGLIRDTPPGAYPPGPGGAAYSQPPDGSFSFAGQPTQGQQYSQGGAQQYSAPGSPAPAMDVLTPLSLIRESWQGPPGPGLPLQQGVTPLSLIREGGQTGQAAQGGMGGAQQYNQGAAQQYGQGTAQQYSQGGAQQYSQGAGQQYSQGGAQQYNQGGAQQYSQGGAQQYSQGGAQQYNQGAGQQYSQGAGQQYSQGGPQQYNQGAGQQYNQGPGQQYSQGGAQQPSR